MARRAAFNSLEDQPPPWRPMALCALLAVLLLITMGQAPETSSPPAAANAGTAVGEEARLRPQSQPDSHFPAKLSTRGEPMEVKIRLPNTDDVELVELTDGSYRYLLYNGSRTESLTPEEFTQRLANDKGTPLKTLLNITTPMGMVWVGLGLLGQLLFTGRMVVQWAVSEKHKRSVVPVSFWWMSLGGGVMLMVYFIWRKDIVGVLGQSTGVLIYARNLWLIFLRGGQKREVEKRHHEKLEGNGHTDAETDSQQQGPEAGTSTKPPLPSGVVTERGNVG